MVVEDNGGLEAIHTTTFQFDNSGKKYTTSVEYTVPIPLLGKLAEAFIVRQNEHEVDVVLANVKARMEV